MSRYLDYAGLKVELRGRALWVSMDAPPLNPVSGAMHASLARIFGDSERDPDVKLVVLTGVGESFSAGGDIHDMKQRRDDMDHHMSMFSQGVRIIHSMLSMAKPLVARINGHAIGFGATLALLCDITVARDDIKIGDPHVRVGLAAGDGGALIWPHLIGISRAKEYLMTGRSIPAKKAAEIGLINHAVPVGELEAKVKEFTDYFEQGPSLAINYTKVAINQYLRQYAEIASEAQMGLEARTVFSRDHKEAVDAFLEKRSPTFL